MNNTLGFIGITALVIGLVYLAASMWVGMWTVGRWVMGVVG